MGWVRASGLDRVWACAGPVLLPGIPREVKSERALEAAAWGTMAHRWKATGRIEAETGYSQHAGHFRTKLEMSGVTEATRAELWPGDGAHEVGIAVDCSGSGVALLESHNEGDLDPWKLTWPPSWATGTLDYVGWDFETLWIDDLKTGAWPPTPPGESLQLRLYALAVLRLHPEYTGDRVLLTVTHWPRYPRERRPRRFEYRIVRKALDKFERGLRLKWAAVERNRGASAQELWDRGLLVPGEEQCAFCPAAGVCPALEVS